MMKICLKKMPLLAALLIFIGCKESSLKKEVMAEVLETQSVPLINNEWNDNPYKVNVVYFIPNDSDSVPNFRTRISKILLDGQSFFGKNLEREGFGRTSFGLSLANDTLVNMVVIKGAKGKSSYPYSSGELVIQPEVVAYFAAHPSEKLSDHYLVILPSSSGNPLDPGGVPFYGTGRFCYALDYEYLDAKYLGEKSTKGSLATKWIGGLIHELGHGLNAPHNYGTKSSEIYGTALMGAGNSTYGVNPTYITRTSAAIFANSQTFSKVMRTDWNQDFKFSLNRLKSSLSNGKIILSGKFTSTQQIKFVSAYFDPEPYGSALDYDVISFGNPSINNDSLYLECPISDFKKLSGKYELNLHFISGNGLRKSEPFLLSFENNLPVLTTVFTKDLSNRSTWTVQSSGDQSGSPIISILDNYTSTVWHSPWSPTEKKHPHHFIVDTKNSTSFNTIYIYNRSNTNGAIKDFKLQSSNDGVNWTTVGQFTSPKKAGIIYIPLGQLVTARYIRVESINSNGGFNYVHMAEFDVSIQ